MGVGLAVSISTAGTFDELASFTTTAYALRSLQWTPPFCIPDGRTPLPTRLSVSLGVRVVYPRVCRRYRAAGRKTAQVELLAGVMIDICVRGVLGVPFRIRADSRAWQVRCLVLCIRWRS